MFDILYYVQLCIDYINKYTYTIHYKLLFSVNLSCQMNEIIIDLVKQRYKFKMFSMVSTTISWS